MPRPPKEVPLTEEQEWFLAVIDRKFREQEHRLRDLLNGHPAPGFALPVEPLERRLAPGARPAESRPEAASPEAGGVESTRSTSSAKKRKTLAIQARVMGEELKEPPVKRWVKQSLDGYMGLVVVINLSLMMIFAQMVGHKADYSLGLTTEEPGTTVEEVFGIVDYLFFGIYVLDVMLRMLVLKKEWVFDPVDGTQCMNIFDLLLVLVHGVELLVLPTLLLNSSQEQSASSVRVVKLVRVVRTLRIIKTVSMFRQLRMLVTTCMASVGALFWSMILLFMLKVGFGLMICQALQGFILDSGANLETRLEMNNLYGSFSKSLYTFFEITHSGSWPSRVRPVIEKVSFWYAVPFLIYIALVVFAVIRVVTALFLQETLASAANDAELQLENSRRLAMEYQAKLEELFQVVDNDGNGSLTQEEFIAALSLPNVQRYLTSLDVRIQDCRPLFEILDDGDGRITIVEFCKGLMQLKGQARALDIHMLHRENNKVLQKCQDIHHEVTWVCKALLAGQKK